MGLFDRDGDIPTDPCGHHRLQPRQEETLHLPYLSSINTATYTVRVHVLVQLLAAEEVLEMLLDLTDTGRTIHQDNLMDLSLGQFDSTKGLLHRLQRAAEKV